MTRCQLLILRNQEKNGDWYIYSVHSIKCTKALTTLKRSNNHKPSTRKDKYFRNIVPHILDCSRFARYCYQLPSFLVQKTERCLD